MMHLEQTTTLRYSMQQEHQLGNNESLRPLDGTITWAKAVFKQHIFES